MACFVARFWPGSVRARHSMRGVGFVVGKWGGGRRLRAAGGTYGCFSFCRIIISMRNASNSSSSSSSLLSRTCTRRAMPSEWARRTRSGVAGKRSRQSSPTGARPPPGRCGRLHDAHLDGNLALILLCQALIHGRLGAGAQHALHAVTLADIGDGDVSKELDALIQRLRELRHRSEPMSWLRPSCQRGRRRGMGGERAGGPSGVRPATGRLVAPYLAQALLQQAPVRHGPRQEHGGRNGPRQPSFTQTKTPHPPPATGRNRAHQRW